MLKYFLLLINLALYSSSHFCNFGAIYQYSFEEFGEGPIDNLGVGGNYYLALNDNKIALRNIFMKLQAETKSVYSIFVATSLYVNFSSLWLGLGLGVDMFNYFRIKILYCFIKKSIYIEVVKRFKNKNCELYCNVNYKIKEKLTVQNRESLKLLFSHENVRNINQILSNENISNEEKFKNFIKILATSQNKRALSMLFLDENIDCIKKIFPQADDKKVIDQLFSNKGILIDILKFPDDEEKINQLYTSENKDMMRNLFEYKNGKYMIETIMIKLFLLEREKNQIFLENIVEKLDNDNVLLDFLDNITSLLEKSKLFHYETMDDIYFFHTSLNSVKNGEINKVINKLRNISNKNLSIKRIIQKLNKEIVKMNIVNDIFEYGINIISSLVRGDNNTQNSTSDRVEEVEEEDVKRIK